MSESITGDGIGLYYKEATHVIKQIITSQKSLLSEIAACMAKTVAADGRIFVFGTGHSHMMREEGFYRAGGLACVVPVFSSSLMLHEQASLSSFLERTSGIAEKLFEIYQPLAHEMIFIYSNSGVNTLPVEMAMLARQLGLIVVSVCAMAYARVAPLSATGKRLYEVADYAIDNAGLPGDALIPVPGTAWKVAASSTLANTMIWNCLLTETVFDLRKMNVDIPLIASLNMTGAEEHNRKVLEKWKKINPHLK